MPVISVIIPVYNGAKTIKETIESVLNQTFSDFELILINDGSTDSTLEIVDSIQDSRVKVFSYVNAGLAESRNRGIARATGEYISFIDADDLWTQDKLEAQLKALLDKPDAALAYSWTDSIDESSKFLRPGAHRTVNGDVYAELLVENFLANGSNPLIRSQALAEVGKFDNSLLAGEDWDMWLRLAARFHFVAVPYPQILYRQVANSLSANVIRQERECLKVIERAFNQAPASLQHLKKESITNIYQYLIFRSLEGSPNRSSSLVGAGYLWKTVRFRPSILWRRRRLMAIVFLKILVGTLIPPQQAEAYLARIKELSRAK
ncbi:MAG: glycosyltransferase [Hormoscilla sp.]